MSVNPTRCSNCGTDNPPEADKCVKCGMPLTGSADEALRTQLETENAGGLLNAREDANLLGSDMAAGVQGGPITPPRSTT